MLFVLFTNFMVTFYKNKQLSQAMCEILLWKIIFNTWIEAKKCIKQCYDQSRHMEQCFSDTTRRKQMTRTHEIKMQIAAKSGYVTAM